MSCLVSCPTTNVRGHQRPAQGLRVTVKSHARQGFVLTPNPQRRLNRLAFERRADATLCAYQPAQPDQPPLEVTQGPRARTLSQGRAQTSGSGLFCREAAPQRAFPRIGHIIPVSFDCLAKSGLVFNLVILWVDEDLSNTSWGRREGRL